MSKLLNLIDLSTTIVSEEDYDYLSNFLWRPTGRTKVYVGRNYWKDNKCIMIYIHRVIGERMGLDITKEIDHIDRNPRNNIRENLRVATNQETTRNASKTKRKTSSKYKGVCYQSSRRKWQAQISINGIDYNLGRFNTEEEAAEAYNESALKYFGQFAVLNIIK